MKTKAFYTVRAVAVDRKTLRQKKVLGKWYRDEVITVGNGIFEDIPGKYQGVRELLEVARRYEVFWNGGEHLSGKVECGCHNELVKVVSVKRMYRQVREIVPTYTNELGRVAKRVEGYVESGRLLRDLQDPENRKQGQFTPELINYIVWCAQSKVPIFGGAFADAERLQSRLGECLGIHGWTEAESLWLIERNIKQRRR